MLQYKDHHPGYGPLVAGRHGLTFISLRNRTGDSHPVYIGRPGYREKLLPSQRRNWGTPPNPLSTRPVLQQRTNGAREGLLENRQKPPRYPRATCPPPALTGAWTCEARADP